MNKCKLRTNQKMNAAVDNKSENATAKQPENAYRKCIRTELENFRLPPSCFYELGGFVYSKNKMLVN